MRKGSGTVVGVPQNGGSSHGFVVEAVATLNLILRPINALDMTDNKTWMCLICGWIYDESVGAPDEGIPPGTRWPDVPMNWVCPECGARKEDFEMVQL